ncbi:PucR family transcriptional regulator [Flexivirga meconopsidis]|uniref:PucR family transcriptional regulator n=1 Tax=Flexivirga meconopsidis TaxID=2977121 RepID=UPI00224017CE|nr:helix-turn-helix domain-containing protein [Flexivirga meconopsidis]
MRPLQQFVEHLAGRLSAPLLVVGPAGDLVAYSSHPPYDDPLASEAILCRAAPAALRALLDQQRGSDEGAWSIGHTSAGAERFAIPLRHDDLLCGYLIGSTAPDDGAQPVIDELCAAAHELALGLIVFRKERDTSRGDERRAIHDLLSTDSVVRHDATLRIQEQRWIKAAPVTAVVVAVRMTDGSADDARIQVSLAVEDVRDRFPARSVISLPGPDHGVLLLATDDPEVVARAAQTAHDRLGEKTALVGVGRAVDRLGDSRESFLQALRAVRVESVDPTGSPRAFADLGVYELLTGLAEPELHTAMGAAVIRLLEHEETQAASLAATLETYLDLGGDARAAAEALYVHRATLYQRLRRIEQVTDVDLADGRARLACHLGIKAARLLGRYDRAG